MIIFIIMFSKNQFEKNGHQHQGQTVIKPV